jgi:DNA helicase-2/ATP-dependent DNA helicase PcrA
MFVDEYQDCCGTQHEMIGAIAEVLPCRVVGDPLQAIYRKLHASDITKWSDVEGMFPTVGVLAEPHRWRRNNAKLGEWLGDVRSRLVEGTEVDFSNGYGVVKWIPSADVRKQIAACYKAFDKGNVVAICDWPGRCASIAGKTRNHFAVLESVECPDLLRAAEDIKDSHGLDRVACVVGLAQRCFTGMTWLTGLVDRMKKREAYSPRLLEKGRLWIAMQTVADSADLWPVENMMSVIDGLSCAHFYIRRELWRDMRRSLQTYDSGSGRTLGETAWALRDHARRNGRRVLSKRTVATPLLIKGLEFDHALLLDAMQMGSAEELYVALTRGSSSLTVLSSERRVKHSAPAWIRENNSEGQSLI